MSTTIELAHVGLSGQIDALVSQIDTATAEEAKSAYDRMGIAREWAKLQEDATVLIERLVWLEAVILRRIGQLDPRCLGASRRSAARHFATLDDADLSRLVNDYPARTAVAVYNLWAKAEGMRKERKRGASFAIGHRPSDARIDTDDEIGRELRYAIETKVVTVRQAAAVIIDEYCRDLPRTVTDVVDTFIDEEMPTLSFDSPLKVSAFRSGLSHAVREAFANAPVEATERSWEIPAFITTYEEEHSQWVRIPSEFATVGDAIQMLALREGQVESARRSCEALAEVLERRFRISDRAPSEHLRDDMTAMSRRMATDRSMAL